MAIIGKYKVRYRGESIVVPVDSAGLLLLPDGNSVVLPPEKFAVVKAEIEKKANEEMAAKGLTVPDLAEEKMAEASEVVNEKTAEDASQATGSTALVVNNQDSAAFRRKEAAEQKRREKEAEKEEKRLKKLEKKEAAKARKQSAMVPKSTAVITGLVVALIMLVVFSALFALGVQSGIITIHVEPPANGLIIDDTLNALSGSF